MKFTLFVIIFSTLSIATELYFLISDTRKYIQAKTKEIERLKQ